jgi:hypothetical protein
MERPHHGSRRRLGFAVMSVALAAAATWLGMAVAESRQRAWAEEAAQQQATAVYAIGPAVGELFPAVR